MGDELHCNQPDLAALLPAYYDGLLDESTTKLLNAHLAECSACGATLNMIEMMANQGKHDTESGETGHIQAGLIARYYSSRDELTAAEIVRIESHLAGCAECAEEYGFLTGLEDDLRASIGGAGAPVQPLPKTEPQRFSLLRSPALAAAAMILIVIGAAAIWQAGSWVPESGNEQTELFTLRETYRDGVAATVITRPANATTVRLAIEHYHLTAEYNYRFAIHLRADNEPVVLVSEAALDNPGVIHLTADMRSLSDGNYLLVMEEILRANPTESNRRTYSFTLETRSR